MEKTEGQTTASKFLIKSTSGDESPNSETEPWTGNALHSDLE